MSLRTVITLVKLISFGLLCSSVIGNENYLIIPAHVDKPVVLRLLNENVDWEKTDPSSMLQIFVGQIDGCCNDKIPVTGRYEFDGHALIFTPAFSFVVGQEYVAQIQMHQNKKGWFQERTEFSIESDRPLIDAKVIAVYPSADLLPENILRFYIHFAAPMKPHVAFNYIKLVDASGNVDNAAFMKFKQELWNEDRTRLTLLIDPGRIKRKVATNLRLGSTLHMGEQYKLRIEEGWPTADGASIISAFSKQFVVTNALRKLPKTNQWEIIAPKIKSQDAIKIGFDRPFDYQRLHKDIQIYSEDGSEISGEIQINNNEYEWRFLPAKPWNADKIFLIVDSMLEDVAGNNFRDLLDHSVESEAINRSQISILISLKS